MSYFWNTRNWNIRRTLLVVTGKGDNSMQFVTKHVCQMMQFANNKKTKYFFLFSHRFRKDNLPLLR